jgi:hypothetical protein
MQPFLIAITVAVMGSAGQQQAQLASADPCAALAKLHPLAAGPVRAAKCAEVAAAAEAMGAEPVEVVALAWRESTLKADAVSPTGVRNALQVSDVGCRAWLRAGSPGAYSAHPVRMVEYRGATVACDVVAAGVWQWGRRRSRGNVREAACAYTRGSCPAAAIRRCERGHGGDDCAGLLRAWRWAGSVAGLARKLRERTGAGVATVL